MPEQKTSRLKSIQRSALVLLVVAGTLNYIDRTTLAIGGTTIRSELGLSIGEMGLLLSAFLWAYAFCQLPGGVLIDRIGARRLLGSGLALWSIAQAAAGLSSSLTQFAAARLVLGVGEAPMYASGARVVRDWYNVRARGLATGIFNCSSTLGPTIAPPILTLLMLNFGWRSMFVIVGVAGLIVSLVWFLLYREVREAGLTPNEQEILNDGQAPSVSTPITFAEWRRLFTFRMTWGLLLGFFGVIYLIWLFQAWLPGYLEMQRHMSLQKTGWVAAIPYAFGVIGSIGTGFLADKLMAAGLSPINSRRVPAVISLLGMALFTFLAAEATSNTMAVGCITVVMFFSGAASAMAWALISVAGPENVTGSLGGIMNFGGYIGGALAPMTTGYIVQATGDFVPALMTGAAIGVASAAAYIFVMPGEPISAAETTGLVPFAAAPMLGD
jgi:sugar phosphate permease